jgi:hypothetical protein
MRTDLLATAALAALLVAPTVAGAQQAGYTNAPFRDHPVAVAQGAALERIEVAARALAVTGAGDDDGDQAEASDEGDQAKVADGGEEDEEEGGPLADFGQLRASLATASPELADELGEAVEEMVEAAERGTGVDESAEAVIALTGAARDQLLPSELAATPGFQAALMASLLLEEGGVAEGYEEATEGEAQAYATGYFALQQVKALWQGLAGKASPQQAADVRAMLAMLDGLFPTQELPEQLSPDPEQAEAPAQQLVGVLEGVADAELYLGRDLAAASGVVHDLAAQGCASLEAGQAAVGVEQLRIAAAYYAQTVSDTLGLMAPETAEAVDERLEEVGEGNADELAEACGPLLQALTEGKAALTP